MAFDGKAFGEEVVAAVRDYVSRATEPLKQQIAELERRVAEADQRGLRYRGVHQKAESYKRGDAVTHDGSLWICLRAEAEGRPGTSDDWQLAVKAGRDGKDAR